MLENESQSERTWCDRMFGLLLVVEFGMSVALAAQVAPRAWADTGIPSWAHLLSAFVVGLVLVLPVCVRAFRGPSTRWTRISIAIVQMLMDSFMVHLSGGRIEAHFHVFGSLAILTLYRDPEVIVVASTVVGLDHVFRGLLWPRSIYGVNELEPWRCIMHLTWIFFVDAFLLIACRRFEQIASASAERRARIEIQQQQLVEELRRRVSELTALSAKAGEAVGLHGSRARSHAGTPVPEFSS
jgi:hypothetical protein